MAFDSDLSDQFSDATDARLHRALAQRAADVLAAETHVLAVLLGGSLTRGTGDAFSDVDLLIVHDDAPDAWERIDQHLLGRLNEIGEAVHSYRMITGRDLRVYFKPQIMLEFVVRSKDEARSRWKTALCEVLFDRSSIVGELQNESARLKPSFEDDLDQIKRTIGAFCVVCTRVQGYYYRGERMTAHDDLAWLRDRMLWLSSSVLEIWFEGPRRGEQQLPGEIVDVWRSSLPVSDDDILTATNALVDWYENWLVPRLQARDVDCPMVPIEMHKAFVKQWEGRG